MESYNSHWRDPRCMRLSCKSRSIPTVRLRSRPSQAFVESAGFFHNDVGCGCDGHLWWDQNGICQSTSLLVLMGAGIRIILDLPNVSVGTGSSDAITLRLFSSCVAVSKMVLRSKYLHISVISTLSPALLTMVQALEIRLVQPENRLS